MRPVQRQILHLLLAALLLGGAPGVPVVAAPAADAAAAGHCAGHEPADRCCGHRDCHHCQDCLQCPAGVHGAVSLRPRGASTAAAGIPAPRLIALVSAPPPAPPLRPPRTVRP